MTSLAEKKERGLKGGRFASFGKYSFALWIAYQTIKGTLTTTFIWAPLVYLHFFH